METPALREAGVLYLLLVLFLLRPVSCFKMKFAEKCLVATSIHAAHWCQRMEMKATYSLVRNPRWASNDRNSINCWVKFNDMKVELPYNAVPNGDTICAQIFNECVAGQYGEIAEFDPTNEEYRLDNLSDLAPLNYEGLVLELDEFHLQNQEFDNFLNEANLENATGSLRGQVLVWSSFIEVLVERLIENHLVDHKESRDFLKRPEINFSTKIRLAFSLGLISKQELKTLNNVRDLRNEAAHRWKLDLENGRVRKPLEYLYNTYHSKLYEWIEEPEFLIRNIYTPSCAFLAWELKIRWHFATENKCKIFDLSPSK